jgi:hypothetical protein
MRPLPPPNCQWLFLQTCPAVCKQTGHPCRPRNRHTRTLFPILRQKQHDPATHGCSTCQTEGHGRQRLQRPTQSESAGAKGKGIHEEVSLICCPPFSVGPDMSLFIWIVCACHRVGPWASPTPSCLMHTGIVVWNHCNRKDTAIWDVDNKYLLIPVRTLSAFMVVPGTGQLRSPQCRKHLR